MGGIAVTSASVQHQMSERSDLFLAEGLHTKQGGFSEYNDRHYQKGGQTQREGRSKKRMEETMEEIDGRNRLFVTCLPITI